MSFLDFDYIDVFAVI